jgi:dipeptidyl aminopeptidase/acylaminoacyl peptidase
MRAFAIAAALLLLSVPHQITCAETKRNITVEDSIEFTRLADADYFRGAHPDRGIAEYSPNGEHFVVVLRKGDLKTNANEYSIYLFATSAIFQPRKPHLLLTIRTASGKPGIRGIKWLEDNKTLAFLGNPEDGLTQIYTVNIETKQLTERTNHRTAIDQFDISLDGKKLIFTAAKEDNSSLTPEQHLHGIVVQDQTLEDILTGRFNRAPGEEQLFYQERNEEEIAFPPTHQVNVNSRLTFSPDGHFASVTAYFRATSTEWTAYNNMVLRFWGRNPAPLGGPSPVSQFFLFDCLTRSIRTLLEAPAVYTASSHWAKDSHAIYLKTYLPLDGTSETERSKRIEGELPVEIAVPDLTVKQLSEFGWQQASYSQSKQLPAITLEEDLNAPPRIVAQDRLTNRSVLLMVLNPQFAGLIFGRVEVLHLMVHGIPIIAGLYLPPGYVAGSRYPLVLQTHGFDSMRFSMDGRYEWSSGFAARALAAAGIMVVQMQEFENPGDHDRVGNDRTLGKTLESSFRNFAVACYAQAIQTLSDKGMINPDRVGISGFSRTVWFVSYLLTHSEKQKFRTAILTDGIDGGYFEYIARRLTEFDADNGGMAPFGKDGLDLWREESPTFNLDRVCIPVRLVSIEDRLAQWEWFVAAKLEKKPVELIEVPDGTHMLEKPSDRYIAMEGIVDWFRFWLQGYVDPSQAKAMQYDRWRSLTEAESKESLATCQK